MCPGKITQFNVFFVVVIQTGTIIPRRKNCEEASEEQGLCGGNENYNENGFF